MTMRTDGLLSIADFVKTQDEAHVPELPEEAKLELEKEDSQFEKPRLARNLTIFSYGFQPDEEFSDDDPDRYEVETKIERENPKREATYITQKQDWIDKKLIPQSEKEGYYPHRFTKIMQRYTVHRKWGHDEDAWVAHKIMPMQSRSVKYDLERKLLNWMAADTQECGHVVPINTIYDTQVMGINDEGKEISVPHKNIEMELASCNLEEVQSARKDFDMPWTVYQ